MRHIGLLLGSLLCSACAFQSQVDRATVDYNQAVANSNNELTLLNVVRAMRRYPLHFTTISKISGSFKVTGRAGLGMDINEGGGNSKLSPAGALLEQTTSIGTEKITPSVGAEVSAGPNFDIGILDTQEFYQGILASVAPDMVANFLNLGWRDDVVASMLIERIEFHVPRADAAARPVSETEEQRRQREFEEALRPGEFEGDEAVWVLTNDPDSHHFGRFLRCFRLKPNTRVVPAEPVIALSQVEKPKFADVLHIDGDKLRLSVEVKGNERMIERVRAPIRGVTFRDRIGESAPRLQECAFRLEAEVIGVNDQDVSVDIFHIPPRGSGNETETAGREGAASAAGEAHDEGGAVVVQLTAPGQQNATGIRPKVPAFIHIVFRSAQAVLYFLGEYARQDELARTDPKEAPSYLLVDDKKLIVVRQGGARDAFLTTRLNGETYSIPAAPAEYGRSPTAIDLAQQLVNLNKSAKDKPATASFRIEN